jgi:hypothetical protein
LEIPLGRIVLPDSLRCKLKVLSPSTCLLGDKNGR